MASLQVIGSFKKELPLVLKNYDNFFLPANDLEKGVVFLAEPYEINTGLAAEFEDPFRNRHRR